MLLSGSGRKGRRPGVRSLYLAWCDVNILKGQRVFNSRECTVSFCFFYVSNSCHIIFWFGGRTCMELNGNWWEQASPQQLGLQIWIDLNCCFGIARTFAKERRYPTLNLSTSPSPQPGFLLVGCHRRCKTVGWVGSWCYEWRIEVLKNLKELYMDSLHCCRLWFSGCTWWS